jgi:hypothetical protein
MAARRIRSTVADLNSLMPTLTQAVRERGAIGNSQLTQLGVPKAQHEEALARLGNEGFEITAKGIRLPIRQQLRRRLEERTHLPIKGLEKLVIGCTAKEVLSIVDEFIKEGVAYRILRTKADWIVTANADVLSADEVSTLSRLIADWAKRTKKVLAARKTSITFWRNDVKALIEELAFMKNVPSRRVDIDERDKQSLLEMISKQLDANVGLAFVPAVIEKSQLPVERAQSLLLDLARSGKIELRPDSGTVRFTQLELQTAPAGPDGSRLLWTRVDKEAS